METHLYADMCVYDFFCCEERNFLIAIYILLSDFSSWFSWVESCISSIMLTYRGWTDLNLRQLQDKGFY